MYINQDEKFDFCAKMTPVGGAPVIPGSCEADRRGSVPCAPRIGGKEANGRRILHAKVRSTTLKFMIKRIFFSFSGLFHSLDFQYSSTDRAPLCLDRSVPGIMRLCIGHTAGHRKRPRGKTQSLKSRGAANQSKLCKTARLRRRARSRLLFRCGVSGR